jgi:hypothetical protein
MDISNPGESDLQKHIEKQKRNTETRKIEM